jgi:hypothetical protein
MLPRMRELTVIYGYGGSWPVSVAIPMMSRRDSYFGQMLRESLKRSRPSPPPRPPRPT